MSIRRADGVDDWLQVAVGGADFVGDYTLVALVRAPAALSDEQAIMVGENFDADICWVLGGGAVANSFGLYVGTQADAPAGFLPPNEWRLIGFTKAAGSTRPRMHSYDFAAGAWSHADGSVALGNPATQDGGNLACFAVQRAFNHAAIDIAAAAIWRTAVTDAAFETLRNVASLGEWANESPDALWLFNQASVADPLQDLVGTADQTAIAGTTVIDQDPPIPYEELPGITVTVNVDGVAVECPLFRNVGGAAVPVTRHEPLAGDGSFLGFAARPPGAGWRAYAPASPFNQPVGTSPTVHPQSAAIVAAILDYADSEGNNVPANMTTEASPAKDFSHPKFYALPTDPLVTLDLASGGRGLDGSQIRCPAAATPAGGSDGHVYVVQPDGWENSFWQARIAGGVLSASIGYRQRYDGLGIVTPAVIRAGDGSIGGNTAPYFGMDAGVIRGAELAAGRIDHALFAVIAFGASDTSFGYGTIAPGANGAGGAGASVYPAYKGDAVNVDPSVPAAPMGARFWLEMSDEEIEQSDAPAWEQTIAKACARYGAFFGDTGGPGFAFMLESALTHTALGRTNPLRTVAVAAGIGLDPTWGYTFVFGRDEAPIPWADRLRVVLPPAH